MGIHHKAFHCKNIMAAILVCFAFISSQAQAYDTIYVVDNVKVDVMADNSVTAQEQAFDKAQVQAFKVLAQRMVAEGQAKSVKTPNVATISTMIKDYEVKNEQISAVRYIGTYIFRFRESAVDQFFSVSGVSYITKSSQPLMVLPVYQSKGKNTIWSEGNLWMQAWARTRVSNALVPVEVPIGDLSDINDIDDNDVLRYERTKLSRMLARYNASEAAIMIAVPDYTLESTNTEADIAKGRLRVSIYRTDRAQAEHVGDITIEADGIETVAALYDRAVTKGHSALQKSWKRKTVSSAAQAQKYSMRASFQNMREWVAIQRSINNMSGINDVRITSIRKGNAKLSLSFRGNESQLSTALARKGLKLLRSDVSTQGEPDVLYDVFLSGSKSTGFYRPAEDTNNGTSNAVHTF